MAIMEVIKYEGGNDVLVWKHPKEDFNTSAQLIVHETQEAIVFRDGTASGIYKAGKHTIETENIPGVRKLVSLVTGGISPNHYEIYFINKAYSMNVYWGTTTPITVQDPVWQVPFRMRSHGQFAVRAEDSRQLIMKLVGTTSSFTQSTLTEHFKGLLMSRIKDYISNMMVQQGLSFLEINSYLSTIADGIKAQIAPVFAGYGLSIEEFFIESINIEEDAVYQKIRDSLTDRTIRKIEGYDYDKERTYDILQAQAENQGAGGQMAGMAVGAASGVVAGQMIGGMMQNTMQSTLNRTGGMGLAQQTKDGDFGVLKPKTITPKLFCKSCGAELPDGVLFCHKCGAAVQPTEKSCPHCGKSLPGDSAFCCYCGQQL